MVLKISCIWDNKPSSLRIHWLYLIGLLLRLGTHNEICQYIQNKLHVYRHYFRDKLDVRKYNYSYDGRNYTIAILKGRLLMYTDGRQPSYWFFFLNSEKWVQNSLKRNRIKYKFKVKNYFWLFFALKLQISLPLLVYMMQNATTPIAFFSGFHLDNWHKICACDYII